MTDLEVVWHGALVGPSGTKGELLPAVGRQEHAAPAFERRRQTKPPLRIVSLRRESDKALHARYLALRASGRNRRVSATICKVSEWKAYQWDSLREAR